MKTAPRVAGRGDETVLAARKPFGLEGRQGHEIIFVFDAQFVDESLYTLAMLRFHEAGWAAAGARWFDLNTVTNSGVRLAPAQLQDMLLRKKMPCDAMNAK